MACTACQTVIKSLFRGILIRKHAPVTQLISRNSTTTIEQDPSTAKTSAENTGYDTSETTGDTEYDTKQRILIASLPFVHQYGWTSNALVAGAEQEGFPGVAHGMFPRGGAELVFFFYRDCNQKLASQMKVLTEEREEKPKTGEFIKMSVESRLRMIIPYIDKWPQAMAIQAMPQNGVEAWKNLGALMDDIWYYAGDRSVDFNWYTKRVSLAGVYKSTEIYMLQDSSEDYQDTWDFLDRRLKDLTSFGKFARNIQQSGTVISDGLQGFSIMAKNVCGMNSR